MPVQWMKAASYFHPPIEETTKVMNGLTSACRAQTPAKHADVVSSSRQVVSILIQRNPFRQQTQIWFPLLFSKQCVDSELVQQQQNF